MPVRPARLPAFLLAFLFTVFALAGPARADEGPVETAWRLLDYMAVDYPGAVQNGRVVNQTEYDEQVEFSASVVARIAALPPRPQRAALVAEARQFQAAVARKAGADEVLSRAHALGDHLLAAYPVPLAPATPPDLNRGAALYAQNCASCHGADGHADTPAAHALDPAPIAFADRDRARERSLFAYYQVISQGIEGTAMQSWSNLPSQDRWALAFYVARFSYPDSLGKQGEAQWAGDPRLRRRIPDLKTLVGLTPAQLASEIGAQRGDAVFAFLRSDPDVFDQNRGVSSLAVSRALLRQAIEAYRAGDRGHAGDLALRAYLDGFEPVEAILNARDGSLVAAVEREMGGLRAAIARGAPIDDVETRAERVQSLFTQAEAATAPSTADRASTFVGAFAILVREGLEALLIVVAMIGFLIKAERRELLRWVNAGWVIALVAGAATWWVAQRFITISGASREMTEGFGSVLAALILLFVGVWMHGKAQAGAWQRYVKEKLDHALSKGSGWFLFALAFIAVYREVFETIIFYAALGGEGQNTALLGGFLSAVALLALIAWAMLKFSRKLPIAKFFAYSAMLIAILAVVLAGKGVAALQEAGFVGVHPLDSVPRITMLGLFPTVETLGAQIAMIVLLIAGYLFADRRNARIEAARASAST
ncbi:cytochrome c/FTR1 family iron permease [Sphingosinicella ginsenosidimutans]|uniref:C-type cytochrome n=1 Tax=Allosphingosinicella ginsenosidimutans TaxID=1176539 RepID=A0A5C6TSD5_9SPHN|nr:cytochrome c/FTR1 family iron permease [Sphingosinicella ginsenosidimutans]TXC63304.1 c-type cytochrome [Sphingosinicella ginsenosidimutans]